MQKVFLIGRLGSDPITNFSQKQEKYHSLSLCVSVFQNKQEIPVWYKALCFGVIGANIIPKLKKGTAVIVIGSLKNPEVYKKENGEEKVSLTVICDSISFLMSSSSKNLQEKKENVENFEFFN